MTLVIAIVESLGFATAHPAFALSTLLRHHEFAQHL